ncbi:MAG: diguanylate cyclase domain-containing protein [Thermodesulfobacteriota bacterium]
MFAFGHVFNRQFFLFLLDLEIKRARRYQNYLGLLSLTFGHLNPSSGNPNISLETLVKLLKDELRETDVLGQGGSANRLLVMLPHVDMAGAHKVRERLGQILQDYGIGTKGLTIEIGEVCFPTHATNIDDLLRMAGNNLPSPNALRRDEDEREKNY